MTLTIINYGDDGLTQMGIGPDTEGSRSGRFDYWRRLHLYFANICGKPITNDCNIKRIIIPPV